MPLAVGFQRLDRLEACLAHLWPERVGPGAVLPPPSDVQRTVKAVGPLEGLQQLADGVDVAGPRREHAIALRIWVALRRRLGDQVVVAALGQHPGDVLGEAAAAGGDRRLPADGEGRLDDRIDLGLGPAGDRTPPEGGVRQIAIGMAHGGGAYELPKGAAPVYGARRQGMRG